MNMRRNAGRAFITYTIFLYSLLSGLNAVAAQKVGRGIAEVLPNLVEPLVYGRDFIEVTSAGTLRGRYRFHGEWDKEFASYREDARKLAATRGTPCRQIKMGCIFLRDTTITLPDIKGGDGKPMTATYTTPPEFVEEMMSGTMKEYNDYMFTFSGGELEVSWIVETVGGMNWVQPGNKAHDWGCQPKGIGDQITRALEKYKDSGVSMWVFCAGTPQTANPLLEKGKKKGVGGPPYGISYTAWPLYGGYCIVICAPSSSLIVHEFNHRYLDNLIQIEGIRVTRFHGLSRFGFSFCGFKDPLYEATYRYVYQYIIPRDMWRRFTVNTTNTVAKEQFSSKAYAWDAVKDDCWFKLPELSDANLAALTGVNGTTVNGDRKSKTDDQRSWSVTATDTAQVKSPYVSRVDPEVKDASLNNVLQLDSESCAVLKTDTGQWLLVKKELADVYVEMARLSGKGQKPLPVYGYVNRDVMPLVVMKAPSDMPVPSSEIGYFRDK